MRKIIVLCVSIVLFGCVDNNEPPYSNIAHDEAVVFFRTSAWLDARSQEWRIPIHGWIYEPGDSKARLAAFSKILETKYDLAPDKNTDANFRRRANLMIVDSERNKQIVVSIAGSDYVLPPSVENGHFQTTLAIPVSDVSKFAQGRYLKYSAVVRQDEVRSFTGAVELLDPIGFSVISDIDDTVKISNVSDTRGLLESTFFLDFAAAPGMAELYNTWSQQKDTSFHFVSSSPWQLYSPLQEFLDENSFPWATFSLKSVRFRDETLLNLFKEGTATKPLAIEKILSAYPGRKFVLVGDSGEQDPEVYAALLRAHPDRILKIYIRNVTNESAENERFKSLFTGIATDAWQLFENPLTLTLPVEAQ